ncbi:hypothetical protein JCM9957A_30960 [Kineosporia succinea]
MADVSRKTIRQGRSRRGRAAGREAIRDRTSLPENYVRGASRCLHQAELALSRKGVDFKQVWGKAVGNSMAEGVWGSGQCRQPSRASDFAAPGPTGNPLRGDP